MNFDIHNAVWQWFSILSIWCFEIKPSLITLKLPPGNFFWCFYILYHLVYWSLCWYPPHSLSEDSESFKEIFLQKLLHDFYHPYLSFCVPFLAMVCPFCDGGMKTIFSIQQAAAHRLMLLFWRLLLTWKILAFDLLLWWLWSSQVKMELLSVILKSCL